MTLRNDSTYVNSSRVRLVGVDSELEGRLEVRPTDEDEWGTVCDVVCSLIQFDCSFMQFDMKSISF